MPITFNWGKKEFKLALILTQWHYDDKYLILTANRYALSIFIYLKIVNFIFWWPSWSVNCSICECLWQFYYSWNNSPIAIQLLNLPSFGLDPFPYARKVDATEKLSFPSEIEICIHLTKEPIKVENTSSPRHWYPHKCWPWPRNSAKLWPPKRYRKQYWVVKNSNSNASYC